MSSPATGRDHVALNPINYVICLIDAFSFNLGMAFWSLTTIVPLFLHQIHAPNLLIGTLPALVALGYSLPGMFVTRRISTLPVAKWWLFWVAVGERIPLLAIALAIPTIGITHPALTLWLFLGAFAIHAIMLGINQPAYWSVVGKTIPANVRGRMYGWGGAIGGIAGLTVEPITKKLLSSAGIGNLTGFAGCFTLGIIILIVGILPFALINEPVASRNSEIDPHKGHFVKDALKTWREQKPFRVLVTAQVLASASMLAQPFYVLQYARWYELSGNLVAQFTAISVVGAALSSLLWGYLADHFGNKLVLSIGAILGIIGPALMLIHPSPKLFDVVFLMIALSGSALMLAGYNIVIDYAGSPVSVPYYTTIYNMVLTPIRVVAPILAGLIADKIGYTLVFVIAGIAGVLSVAGSLRVKDPERLRLVAVSE